jgi:hypothetical protein
VTDRTRTIVAGLILTVLVLAIYVLRLNSGAGIMVDDAWYDVLAKALANGDGFRLIGSATTVIQSLYPPGFASVACLYPSELPRERVRVLYHPTAGLWAVEI